MATLTNLKAVKYDGLRMIIRKGLELHISGWGLFDLDSNSYISLGDTLDEVTGNDFDRECLIPYAVRTKKTALLIVESGLIDVEPDQLIPESALKRIA